MRLDFLLEPGDTGNCVVDGNVLGDIEVGLLAVVLEEAVSTAVRFDPDRIPGLRVDVELTWRWLLLGRTFDLLGDDILAVEVEDGA